MSWAYYPQTFEEVMTDTFGGGFYLILDAAGPQTTVGIGRGDKWCARESSSGPTMEDLQDLLSNALQSAGISLKELKGSLYAEGPGSTLGLRLGAMFLNVWRALDSNGGWFCYAYNNLVLTAQSVALSAPENSFSLYAPWKKGCFHHVQYQPTSPTKLNLEVFHGAFMESDSPYFVQLGPQKSTAPANTQWVSYPVHQIPRLTRSHPHLFRKVTSCIPYTPTPPEFAKWERQRHRP